MEPRSTQVQLRNDVVPIVLEDFSSGPAYLLGLSSDRWGQSREVLCFELSVALCVRACYGETILRSTSG